MVSKFPSGEAAPNAELLTGVDGVVPAHVQEGAFCAQCFGRFGGRVPELRVFDVLREEHFWQPFARYFPDSVDFEQKFAVWMSGVEHRVNRNGDEGGTR